MSKAENVRIAEKHYAAFNTRAFDDGAALQSDDVTWISIPTGERYIGKAGYKRFLSVWADAMPDAKVEVANIIADDGGVCVRFVGKGTHTGALHTPAGDVPPTGKRIELEFCEVLRMKNGRIVAGEVFFDVATMMRQLGIA